MAKHPYPRARKSVKVPLHAVVDLLATVHTVGHSEQLNAYLRDNKASITIDAKTANLVKDYLASNGLHEQSDTIAAAVHSTDPFDCPYHEH